MGALDDLIGSIRAERAARWNWSTRVMMDTNVMLSASTFRSANAVRTIELASGRDHGLGRREDRQPFHHHADRVRERVLMTFPRRLEAEWRSQP